MASLNKVQIIGNISRDPEVKYTAHGKAVTDLGVAINRSWKDEGGNKKEEVTFVDVTLWGRVAEIAGEYCRKGGSIYIEGRLQMDTWEDKQSGQKRSKLRVVGENLQLLGSRRQEGQENQPKGHHERQQAPSGGFRQGSNTSFEEPPPEEDDERPF
jgi:single-strand DNA-binding protein